MRIQMTSLVLMATLSAALCDCTRHDSQNTQVAAIEASDSVPVSVKKIVRAVADNDSDSFSELVSYPLQRPYPLKDIESKEEMISYYKVMVDDSLRNAVVKARPERWKEYGWRGWAIDDGKYLWVDDNLYDVQYLSKAERHALDSLVNAEVKSIDPDLREGWRPELCLRDAHQGTIYRLDTRTTEGSDADKYRLAVYNKKSKLRGRPSKVYRGKKEMEGSAGTVMYYFVDPAGGEITIEPDGSESANPILISAKDSVLELQKAYWLDLLRLESEK